MAELEVLRCTRCDAPLVLADGDTTKCASCGEVNPIPAAYRELHAARVADTELRATSARMLRRLARPPSMAIKVLARCVDLPMLAFILVYGIPLLLFAILKGLSWTERIAMHYGKDPEHVPIAYTIAAAGAIVLFFAFVPRAIGVYANRRATQRARLLAALQAHPPKVEGGPATCRLCGAPLAVAPDQVLATCSYCHADNALVIDAKLADASTEIVRSLGKTVRDVAIVDRKERSATRRLLIHELIRYTLRVGSIAACFALGTLEDEDHRSTTLGVVGLVGCVVLLFVFIITSMSGKAKSRDSDRADRIAGNDAPEWISVAGPIGVLFVLWLIARF